MILSEEKYFLPNLHKIYYISLGTTVIKYQGVKNHFGASLTSISPRVIIRPCVKWSYHLTWDKCQKFWAKNCLKPIGYLYETPISHTFINLCAFSLLNPRNFISIYKSQKIIIIWTILLGKIKSWKPLFLSVAWIIFVVHILVYMVHIWSSRLQILFSNKFIRKKIRPWTEYQRNMLFLSRELQMFKIKVVKTITACD